MVIGASGITKMRNNIHQSERAKARWSILREALLKNKNATSTYFNIEKPNDITNEEVRLNKHSIHKFAGFQMLQRRSVENQDNFEIVEYDVPIGVRCGDTSEQENSLPLIQVRTKERKFIKTKPSLEELTSHVHFGVDNTGNTRVWDCANVLAFLIMGEKMIPKSSGGDEDLLYSSNVPFIGLADILSLASFKKATSSKERVEMKRIRVIELGSGMAALPSLSLSMLEKIRNPVSNLHFPTIDITITDGHPKAVQSNVNCVKLTHDREKDVDTNFYTASNIECRQLLWKGNQEGAVECAELLQSCNNNQANSEPDFFDLVLVSDCTHFTDFHADLAVTIGRLLRVGGVCILCQPRRGISLDLFVALLHSMNQCESHSPLFQVDLHKDYNKKMSDRHQRLVAERNDLYDANIHYPLYLTVKKLREFSEERDTDRAKDHVKNR